MAPLQLSSITAIIKHGMGDMANSDTKNPFCQGLQICFHCRSQMVFLKRKKYNLLLLSHIYIKHSEARATKQSSAARFFLSCACWKRD